ncbi:glycosyltransferase family 2 protein [Allomesorhizobium alhagi]|uniref:glycosyltransferase family 2 protein n=1 Tax=Allomesorhizobium alhagi TaxID=475067 RepID=UPI001930DF2D|nr:glycosyltransferase family A protein [Mesorhizobium alhagi]
MALQRLLSSPTVSKCEHGRRRFSVIVPIYEHWHLVPHLLACLQLQTFPDDCFEIILVDNGSSSILLPPDLPANATVLHCLIPGSYAARNFAADHATGEWLAFIDADCLPTPEWLEGLDEAARGLAATDALLAGAIDVIHTSEKPNPYEIYDMVRGIPQERYVTRGYGATANLAVPTELFRQLGGFDGNRFSGGDAEFCRRAGSMGSPIRYVPRAQVNHPARATWREIATKARRVKGGQIAAGDLARRRLWIAATIMPPLRNAWCLLRNSRYSLISRMIAIYILHLLWIVELRELLRLRRGGQAERR